MRRGRLMNWTASLALIIVTFGCVWTLADLGIQSWTERTRVTSSKSLLFAVRARQRQYERLNEAYAGSLSTLKMRIPPETRQQISVGTGWMGGKPDFIVEHCDKHDCRATNASGEIMEAVYVAAKSDVVAAPPLKKGKGRLQTKQLKSKATGQP